MEEEEAMTWLYLVVPPDDSPFRPSLYAYEADGKINPHVHTGSKVYRLGFADGPEGWIGEFEVVNPEALVGLQRVRTDDEIRRRVTYYPG
jgi:hypothetical protein